MYTIVIVVAVFFSLVGGIVFLRQMETGLATTALHDSFNWGLYIQGFFYFSALGGGMLAFIAVTTLFELQSLRPVVERAAAVSLSCLICAGGLIAADMGKPFRGINIVKGKNFASPLTWDFILLMVCGILNLVFLLGAVSGDGLFSNLWAVICLMTALAYVSVHTLFFLSKVGNGFRSQPFFGLETLAQSIWGGGALITLIALGVEVRPQSLLVKLLLILTIFVLIPLFGACMVSMSREGETVNYKMIGLDLAILLALIGFMATGAVSGVLLAFVSVAILFAVFFEKYHMLRVYQSRSTVSLPYNQFAEIVTYRPTTAEWLLVFGSVGVCVWLSSAIIYVKML